MELQPTHAAGPRLGDWVKYPDLIAQMKLTELYLSKLAERVGGTYLYVERCAEETRRRADQMAAMRVDAGTIGAHRDAAAVMDAAVAEAQRMASALDALAKGFAFAAAGHEAEYGAVVEAVRAMPVPMADNAFYANR